MLRSGGGCRRLPEASRNTVPERHDSEDGRRFGYGPRGDPVA